MGGGQWGRKWGGVNGAINVTMSEAICLAVSVSELFMRDVDEAVTTCDCFIDGPDS